MAKQSPTHVVILGAGYAGMTATLRLAHKTQRLPVSITLVNGSATFVERIRLHQVAAAEPVRQRPIASLLRSAQVQFVHGWATSLAPQMQQVTVQTARGVEILNYDSLLYALGSTTDKESVQGVHEHALAVGNPADSSLLCEKLRRLAVGETVAVVGGGLTGIETATEIAEQYPALRVQLITSGRVGGQLSERGRSYLHSVFTRLGVSVHEDARIDQVEAQAAVATDGRTFPFALCVWAGPMRALPLAQTSGLAVNGCGQILIDAAMRSITVPSIYAAGDSAAFTPDAGVTTRMACATALPMAAQAADNLYAHLIGKEQQPFRFGDAGQCISLGRRDGLLHFVPADGSAQERIVTGKLAAWIKEAICRAVAFVVTTDWAARAYTWPKWDGQPAHAHTPQLIKVDATQVSQRG